MSFDLACYNKLHERFQFLFETDLIREICKYGHAKIFEADHELMDIGQVITHMPIVIEGSIKILSEDKEGRELLLYYLELGDTCAVTLKCCSTKSKSKIRAITEAKSEILFIPVEKMEDWMVKFRTWRNFILESYDIRLNDMLNAIDSLAFDNLEQRLQKYLREKVMVTKEKKLNITHFQIASDLNSSRVVVSRLLKKLELDGVVRLTRKHVEVTEFSK